MRIMVTGGAGFIGSAVVRHLVLETRAQVLTIDKFTYAGTRTSLKAVGGHPNHRFVQADICDEIAVGCAVSEFRPERIIHLAAESHVDRSITGAKAFVDTNLVGTFMLLELARNYWLTLDGPARRSFRFLHVSTDEVYGSLGDAGFFAIDPTKIETELGWRARETFDAGVEETVRWYLENEWWWRPLRDRVYRGERLGTLQPAG
jgi:dTDP-glucose 4,6-dehydratase